jgi:hypothetical protein
MMVRLNKNNNLWLLVVKDYEKKNTYKRKRCVLVAAEYGIVGIWI